MYTITGYEAPSFDIGFDSLLYAAQRASDVYKVNKDNLRVKFPARDLMIDFENWENQYRYLSGGGQDTCNYYVG